MLCFLATLALVTALDDYYRYSPKKVVYVSKEPEYYKSNIEIIKREPERKTIYEVREPEEKKILVKVEKEEDKKYIIRPSYEPKKDVVVKVLDKKYYSK